MGIMGCVSFYLFSLFLAMPVAFGAASTPSQLSDPEHQALRDFVQWMRNRNYAENVISKWVEDYMAPQFHDIMKKEISKHADPSTHFNPPITIKYIDVIPTDPEAVPIQFNEGALEERFKTTFGSTIQFEHHSHFIPFKETFGEFGKGQTVNYKQVDGQWVEEITELSVLNIQKYYPWAKSTLYPIYVDAQSVFPTNRHIVRNAIKTYEMKPVADSTAGAQLLTFVRNEDSSELFNDNSFQTHAHEWAHAWGQNHHYEDAETGFKSYGTLGTLSRVCNTASDKLASYGSMIDPLQAYLLEPATGFEFPDLVTGKIYSDYLATLESCESPYTPEPNPAVKMSTATKKVSLTTQVTIENVGNIPLALVPVQTKLSCFIKNKLAKRPLVTTKILNWLAVSEKISFSVKAPAHFSLPCESTQAEVTIKTKNVKSM